MKECVQCSKEFVPHSVYHYFCSKQCCGAYNAGKTWDAYFARLIQKTDERKHLTVEFLNNLLAKQNGLCGLSGVQLTKITGKGVISTNASLDRVDSRKGYDEDNIRLVCHYLNSFRGQVSDGEFFFWTGRVTRHNDKSIQ